MIAVQGEITRFVEELGVYQASSRPEMAHSEGVMGLHAVGMREGVESGEDGGRRGERGERGRKRERREERRERRERIEAERLVKRQI